MPPERDQFGGGYHRPSNVHQKPVSPGPFHPPQKTPQIYPPVDHIPPQKPPQIYPPFDHIPPQKPPQIYPPFDHIPPQKPPMYPKISGSFPPKSQMPLTQQQSYISRPVVQQPHAHVSEEEDYYQPTTDTEKPLTYVPPANVPRKSQSYDRPSSQSYSSEGSYSSQGSYSSGIGNSDFGTPEEPLRRRPRFAALSLYDQGFFRP